MGRRPARYAPQLVRALFQAMNDELPPDPREWLRSIMCGLCMAVGFVALVLGMVALAHLIG
jgi:hypothetical protein